MACLDDIVGVRGCGESPTGVYVQQLDGITISDFDKALNTEQQAALPALQEKVRFATLEVLETIRQRLAVKYELKSFIENDVVGYYNDDKEIVAAQAGYLTGYQVRIDKTPYLSFYVGAINLFVNYSGVVPILVYDLIQGKLLDTINVTAIAGEIVTINVDKSYPTHKQRLNLFIGYDASAIPSYRTMRTAIGDAWGDWCGCCISGGSEYIYFRSAKVLSASTKINANMETNSDGAGLSLGYSLSCSFEEYLCNVKNLIAFAVLWKSGENILRELQYSKRLTGVVLAYKTDHKELAAYYEMRYLGQIESILKEMSLPESLCFSCNRQSYSAVVLP